MIQYKPKPDYEKNSFWKGLMIGTALAFLAFLGLTALAPASPANTADVAPQVDAQVQVTTQEALEFTVGTRLGVHQVREVIEIYVEGEHIGDLTIDTDDPVDSLTIEVDEPGLYEYRMNSVTWYVINGVEYRSSGTGSGLLDVQDGDHFSAYFNPSSPIWEMSLQEE
jgi:hypothetical protein